MDHSPPRWCFSYFLSWGLIAVLLSGGLQFLTNWGKFWLLFLKILRGSPAASFFRDDSDPCIGSPETALPPRDVVSVYLCSVSRWSTSARLCMDPSFLQCRPVRTKAHPVGCASRVHSAGAALWWVIHVYLTCPVLPLPPRRYGIRLQQPFQCPSGRILSSIFRVTSGLFPFFTPSCSPCTFG